MLHKIVLYFNDEHESSVNDRWSVFLGSLCNIYFQPRQQSLLIDQKLHNYLDEFNDYTDDLFQCFCYISVIDYFSYIMPFRNGMLSVNVSLHESLKYSLKIMCQDTYHSMVQMVICEASLILNSCNRYIKAKLRR